METIKLQAYVDEGGHLVLDLPLHLANQAVEVTVQVQEAQRDVLGWPVNFFESLDAIEADDMQERPEQLPLETRDEIE